MRILVTGGCGFIGTNFIRYLLTSPEMRGIEEVVNIDKQTYAGRGENLEHTGLARHPAYTLVKGDICNRTLVKEVFKNHKPHLVFHFAAESHVDRSNQDDSPFERTNVEGTEVLARAALEQGLEKFIHISTDEVYGSIKEGSFSELSPLNPSNPYAETKMRAEKKISRYISLGLPAIVTRSANNYGPYQFPEKLLPLFITNLINGKQVPLMWSEENPGLNIRDWLHVEDNCRAIAYLSKNGSIGEAYNIPGKNERTNMGMTRILLEHFGLTEEMIERVPHRKSHDFRYSISGKKLESLGFRYKHRDLNREVKALCSWYERNPDWWRPLKND